MPIPKPKPDESQDDYIGRCISFVKSEDPNTSQDQAVAICFSTWRQSKKLASCYDTIQECLSDQTQKGQTKECANAICNYFKELSENKKVELDENNLIMINPKIDLCVFPFKQLMFYKTLLETWRKRKELRKEFMKEYTIDVIKLIQKDVEDEIIKRNTNA